MVKGQVFDIKKFSIHDGPGIRTTVFFKGCPLNCRWCHNPESQSPLKERLFRQDRCLRCGACMAACEQQAITQGVEQFLTDEDKCTLCGACVQVCFSEAREFVGREMTVPEVMAELKRDVAFYDESGGGVTFSGGEPLMQPEFLQAILQACKFAELHTALDTCGFAPWEILDAVRQYVDLFLYDLKLLEDAKHRQFTGASNTTILNNLKSLSLEGHSIILRIPLVPGINDDRNSLRQMAEFAATLPNLVGVDLLPFHTIASDKYDRLGKEYKLRETPRPSAKELERSAELLRGHGFLVSIGG